MGRLPTHYAGLRIIERIPYILFAEVTIGVDGERAPNPLPNAPAQFPDIDLQFEPDKPFEIHRFIPSALQIGTDGGSTDIADFSVAGLLTTAQIRIRNDSQNNPLTKDFVTMASLVRGSAQQTWEWEEPYYLTTGEGFRVDIRATPKGTDAGDPEATTYRVAFEGFMIIVEGAR